MVPAQLADQVAQTAAEMEEKEVFITEKIQAGASIVGVYPPDEKTLAEFEEWKKKRRARN